VLIGGCFLLSLLVVLLIVLLGCGWEHLDNSNGHVPGLAGGHGIAAVPDRLELQRELKSKGLSPVDEPMWEQDTPKYLWPSISPQQSRYISKHLWLWLCLCCSRYTSEGTVAQG